jgi:predicted CXXCH cytochrome family protein
MEEATDPIRSETAAGQAGESTRRGSRLIVSGAALLALTCTGVFFWLRQASSKPPKDDPPETAAAAAAPAPDPRLTYDGPYRNVRPDVKYVGDAACAACHKDISQKYHNHPMARSLRPIADEAGESKYDRGKGNPFTALGSQFEVRREGNRVWQHRSQSDTAGKPIYEQETEIQYVLGSGARGCSYITDHDGYLFLPLISWYSQQQKWDVSPGAALTSAAGRHVDWACVYCHANRSRFQPSSLNHFDTPAFDGLGIGCERCHGPGELHVARRRGQEVVDPPDDTIVNPARLPYALRESVCRQCHLQSEARVVRRGRRLDEFRPGLPLESFVSVVVPAEDASGTRQAVNHVQQMTASRCYQGGSGDSRLGCISCHDPHEKPAGKDTVSYFRDRCMQCHATRGCKEMETERSRRGNDCKACHMPRYKDVDVAHTASTDHRILRRPDQAPAQPEPGRQASDLPIVRFGAGPADAGDPEGERDLAIAMVAYGSIGKIDMRSHVAQVVPRLQAAVQRDPKDIGAWIALGQALLVQNRTSAALTCYEKVLAIDPQREDAMIGAAALYKMNRRPEPALDLWQRAVKANPWMPLYRGQLVAALIDAGKWDEVQIQAGEWLRLDPVSPAPRQLRISLLIRDGDRAAARAEFARLEALNPPNRDALRAWFDEWMR